MSYQVIARKYRPQKFEEVIGQDHITKTLQNAITSKRIHHAYLFTGARGIGKTTVARILARALNCEKGPLVEPCGKCTLCTGITSGSSLDVQEIDGASNTGVDDVREIRDHTKYVPAGGRYKIYIIDEVHMLSTAAFNALLKTLEEPPPHVIFIFATTEVHKIPATILSRCQRYDFRRIPVLKIVDSLKKIAQDEGIAVDDESLTLIAREATGSLRDAQSLLDQAIAFSGKTVTTENIKAMLGFLDRKLILDLLEAVLARDSNKALSLLSELFEMGTDLARFAMDFLGCLRHLLVMKECGDARGLFDLPQDEVNVLEKLASKSSAEELHQMFQVWYAAADGVARSPFPKMLLEVMLLRLARIEPVRPIAEILEEIEKLKSSCQSSVDSCQLGEKQERQATPATQAPQEEALESKIQKSEAQEAGHGSRVTGHEGNWDEFLRWLVIERPQIASIFEHSSAQRMAGDVVELAFESPFYAEMLLEKDRKSQVEELLKRFFKKTMHLAVQKNTKTQEAASTTQESEEKGVSKKGREQTTAGGSKSPNSHTHGNQQERKRALTKEALETQIVRDAAEIFGARVHDVRIKDEEGK